MSPSAPKIVERSHARRLALALLFSICFADQEARAGNEANFVLYDHHTDPEGTTEINVLNDYSSGTRGEAGYAGQLLEMERAITDHWMAALYFEGDKIDGQDYAFGGWRMESRYRLFAYGMCLNPVLYVEYADLQPDHRYLLEVTGRTDTPTTGASSEIETRLILGQDLNDKLDVAFNWVDDVSLNTGDWEFGYAAGLNYTLLEDAKHRGDGAATGRGGGWSVKEIKLGAELFGGLGDSELGLTLDPNVTQQYAEVNLKSEFSNGMHIQLGAAVGLTKDSERDLLRIMFGYEFE